MTLFEIDCLSVRHRRVQEREDRRAALPAWVLVNVNRDSKQRPQPFTLEEVTQWLGYGSQYVKQNARPAPREPKPPTIDEIKGQLGLLQMFHKGVYGDNGQAEEGT
jgi:hypothetical protein